MGSGYFGSSPRTRGTPTNRRSTRSPSRFIPAHAGNTNICSLWAVGISVHPRARGEHIRSAGVSPCYLGSSPRTRGTRREKYPPFARLRFIPAHAGNTWDLSAPATAATVHPRARGEHRRTRPRLCLNCGSSPRTRGTLRPSKSLEMSPRFIPAHAGNTIAGALARLALTVHPRARGEHIYPQVAERSLNGSSPRTRGTRKS